MPRMSAAVAAATAQQILDRARDEFAAHGYADSSVDAIATSAGVTRGAVYHHYDSKEGLFRAIVAALQAEVAQAVVQVATSQPTDAAGELRAGSHAFLDAITAGPVARILLVDAPAVLGWAAWRDLDAANSQAHLREALSAVGVASSLLDSLTVQLSGAMNEAALWIADAPQDRRRKRQAHEALDVLLDAAIAVAAR